MKQSEFGILHCHYPLPPPIFSKTTATHLFLAVCLYCIFPKHWTSFFSKHYFLPTPPPHRVRFRSLFYLAKLHNYNNQHKLAKAFWGHTSDSGSSQLHQWEPSPGRAEEAPEAGVMSPVRRVSGCFNQGQEGGH